MMLTVRQAAEATGTSKPTILRRIKSNTLSATKDEATGEWRIDPAELHRVFPPKAELQRGEPVKLYDPAVDAAVLRRELEILTAERERERALYEARIQELMKVTALLTDQRPERRHWWQRRKQPA